MASTRNCMRMFSLRRAQCLANADFARPLGDGDEHDIHDADAADDEADTGDAGQQEGKQIGRRLAHTLKN